MVQNRDLPLRPGLWVIGASFSKRWGTKLPPPLDGVKRWHNFRPPAAIKALIKLSGTLLPPWLSLRQHRQAGEFAADILLTSREATAVAFDLRAQVVLRHMNAEDARRLIEAVGQLRSVYICPDMTFDQPRHFLVEQFIPGVAFSQATSAQRAASTTRILSGLAGAPPVRLADAARQQWMDCCALVMDELPQARRRELSALVLPLAAAATTGWIHGDLSAENIIVRQSDCVVIDFDQAAVGPLLCDPLALFMSEAGWERHDLIEAFYRGEFDAAFGALGIDLRGDRNGTAHAAAFTATIGWRLARGEVDLPRARRRLLAMLALAKERTAQVLPPPPSIGDDLAGGTTAFEGTRSGETERSPPPSQEFEVTAKGGLK